MSPERQFLEAVNGLTDLIEASGSRARRVGYLRKPKAAIIRIMRARWRKQRARVLKNTWLKKELMREAAPPKKILPGGTKEIIASDIAGLTVTGREIEAFNDALSDAVSAGARDAAARLSTGIGDKVESFIGEFLKDGGFQRISAELDKTTVDRVSGAVADAYEKGGTYSDVVKAIKGEFSDMTDRRADLIAQTELNDAYSQGQLQFARDTGGEGKSWDPEGEACEICMGNVEDGIIPLDEDFSSGDDAPTAHPGCDCSLEIHAQADEE